MEDLNPKNTTPILTCNLLKLLHTGSNHRSIVFTDADKSKEQGGHKSWHSIIYMLD